MFKCSKSATNYPISHRTRPRTQMRRRGTPNAAAGLDASAAPAASLTATEITIRRIMPEDQDAVYKMWLRGATEEMSVQYAKDAIRELISRPQYLFSVTLPLFIGVTAVIYHTMVGQGVVAMMGGGPEMHLAAACIALFFAVCLVFAGAYGMVKHMTLSLNLKSAGQRSAEMKDIVSFYSKDKHAFVVATRGGEVVGCAAVFPRTVERGGREDGTEGEVGRLSVSPSCRGTGVASRLMQHVEGAAKAFGFTSLYLITASNPAKLLYSKLGYRLTEVKARMLGISVHMYTKTLA